MNLYIRSNVVDAGKHGVLLENNMMNLLKAPEINEDKMEIIKNSGIFLVILAFYEG